MVDSRRQDAFGQQDQERHKEHGGLDPDPKGQGAQREERGGYRPDSTLFSESQPKMNQFERSNYGNMDDDVAQRRQHTGSHAAQASERISSRSADPGQSSYGGFSNQDPRQQRQELRDYTMPKGYTRSDERLRDDICERLAYSGLDVSEVEVKVEQGVVTLEGTVKQRSNKHAIEDHVDDCLGVQDIQNQIRVQRSSSPPDH